jgi:hypothetical protein
MCASHRVPYFSNIEHLKVVSNENRIHRKGKCTQNIDNEWEMFLTYDRLEKTVEMRFEMMNDRKKVNTGVAA